jgi:peptide/nickel transport system substrate-binding protein
MMPYLRILVLLIPAFISACGGGSENATNGDSAKTDASPTRGGTLFRHLESDCKTLNWVLYTTVYENYVLRYINDYLLDYDENLEIIPVLAKQFDVSDDHLRITVRLRDNLRWHDGHPITSQDIKFTLDKILDPAVPAVNKRSWFSKLERLEVIDDQTVAFVWKEPYAPSLHALTQFAPIPKHIYGKGDFLTNPANRNPVGSGAFKFEEWRTSQMISLARNDDYYRDTAYLDRIVFKVIPDRSVALNALKAGELDEMRLRQLQWELLTDDKAFQSKFDKHHYYVPQYNYLSWNCRSIWFKDKRVRKAMTLLFDRKTVNAKLYSGYARLVSGPFYVNSWAYDKSIEPLPFDPEEARRLLDEAGWIDSNNDGVREKDGVEFAFEFLISTSRIGKQFAELLQEQCAKAGVKVNIRQLEGATYFDKVFKGEYDAAALAWRLENDPDMFDTFHSSQVPPEGLNHAFYKNSRVDSLLEIGRVEFDQEKRMLVYHQVHRLIHEDQPYTFVNSVPEKRPINKRLANIRISPDGPFLFYPGGIYWYVKSEYLEAKR